MRKREVTIVNRLGMHARAAAKFVSAASTFESKIWVAKKSVKVDGKSIMEVMMLAAAKGDKVVISAEGPDERAAVKTLSLVVGTKLEEDAKRA